MFQFIDWMDGEFYMNAPAFLFANLLFSPSRRSKMLKDRTLKSFQNIAWDFALVQSWRSIALEGIENNKPVLLISGDKIVRFLAQRLVASSDEEFRGFVVDAWHHNKAKGEAIMDKYFDLHQRNASGKRVKTKQTDEELDALTRKLELQLTNTDGRSF